MPNRPSSRYHRSSFQGLSIIEGKRGIPVAPVVSKKAANDPHLYKQRNERRQRSSSLAQSHQIRDIIATTVKELKGCDELRRSEGSEERVIVEDRLKEVLKKAKESGHSVDKIFSLLGKREEDAVPKHSFVEGLVMLGYEGDQASKDELLKYVVNRFDSNRDGMVSLAEFRRFCLSISSVAWKAERHRLEEAPRDGTACGSAITENRFDVKDIMYAVGPEVFKTSKLFWKHGISVDISLRYCSDLDIITMQFKDAESREQYNTLFVRKSDCAVDREALNEAAALAVQTSDETSDESETLIRKKIEWEFFANYLLTRLLLTKDDGRSCYLLSLSKLHGDKYDLETEKPPNLMAPKTEAITPSGGMDEFTRVKSSFQRDSRQARTSRQSAQELTAVVESALNEILMEGA